MKKRNIYIIDAIAAYICTKAIQNGEIISEVDVTPVLKLYDVPNAYGDIALQRAHGMLRDFMRW